MDACGKTFLFLICICFTLTQEIRGCDCNCNCNCGNGLTGNRYTTDVDGCQGINCQNGGTCLDGINTYICSCPDGFQGDNCKHVLYWSFDTLDNVILMQGNQQMDYDALVEGQVGSAVGTNHTQQQWIDLGIHTETCMTRPDTCGAGGAMSMWYRVIECPQDTAIISTRTTNTSQGLVILCQSTTQTWYGILIAGGYYTVIRNHPIGWVHIAMNFIGGRELELYEAGEPNGRDNVLNTLFQYGPTNGRIIIGRYYSAQDGFYGSVQVDQLLFYNHPLSEEEITRLSQ